MDTSRFLWLNHWLSIFGDPGKILALRHLPKYFKDWKGYNRLDSSRPLRVKDSYPCLSDQTSTTLFDPHYFYQAAWLSRRLAATRPVKHVDIGSSIGMVSIVSAFVPTFFLDYRPLNAGIENLACIAGDGLSLPFVDNSLKSISSLHVIEHIGLGRYGDRLNPHGSELAAKELIRVLSPGGRLFISIPVGRERTQFNAHRIFDPLTVRELFADLKLVSFGLIDDEGRFIQTADLSEGVACEYGCGLFELAKG
jgi:SAM-dependent methyltransferase